MINIIMLVVSVLLVLTDIIVVGTANRLYAGTFIRKLRYFVYSISPARYIFIIAVFGIVGLIAGLNFKNICVLELLLLAGILLTYTEKAFTLKKKKNKSLLAKRLKPIQTKERINKL